MCVEPPSDAHLKQISVNTIGVWALDKKGRLYVRKGIADKFSNGTDWQVIEPDPVILSK